MDKDWKYIPETVVPPGEEDKVNKSLVTKKEKKVKENKEKV